MQQSFNFNEPSAPAHANNFARFHKDNPFILNMLIELALEYKNAGRKRLSMDLLLNKLRWDFDVQTKDDLSNLKINNNYRSYYARAVMEAEPRLKGFFKTRKRQLD